MHRWITRSIAMLLILTALTGVGLSVSGIVIARQVRPLATVWGTKQMDTAQETLSSLNEALSILEDTLCTADTSLQSVNETLKVSAQTLGDTQPILKETQTLLDEQIPHTITETQAALYTAQQGVSLIEQTLRVITLIPFIPGEPYQPQISLSDSLGQIALALGQIPQSTADLSNGIQISKANLATLQINLLSISLQLDDIQENLQGVLDTLPQYHQTIAAQQAQITSLRQQFPRWIALLANALTVFLVWLGLTQVGLLLQGVDWWQRGNGEAAKNPLKPADETPAS